MGSYKLKSSHIEAEIYKDGMEDGFMVYSTTDAEYLGDYESFDSRADVLREPYIINSLGKQSVNEGDYIVTFPDGEKYVYEPWRFESNFEVVTYPSNQLTVAVDIKNFEQLKSLLSLIKYLYSVISNENIKKHILDEISHIANLSDYKNECESICSEFNRFKEFIFKNYADELGEEPTASTFVDFAINIIKNRC